MYKQNDIYGDLQQYIQVSASKNALSSPKCAYFWQSTLARVICLLIIWSISFLSWAFYFMVYHWNLQVNGESCLLSQLPLLDLGFIPLLNPVVSSIENYRYLFHQSLFVFYLSAWHSSCIFYCCHVWYIMQVADPIAKAPQYVHLTAKFHYYIMLLIKVFLHLMSGPRR